MVQAWTLAMIPSLGRPSDGELEGWMIARWGLEGGAKRQETLNRRAAKRALGGVSTKSSRAARRLRASLFLAHSRHLVTQIVNRAADFALEGDRQGSHVRHVASFGGGFELRSS